MPVAFHVAKASVKSIKELNVNEVYIPDCNNFNHHYSLNNHSAGLHVLQRHRSNRHRLVGQLTDTIV